MNDMEYTSISGTDYGTVKNEIIYIVSDSKKNVAYTVTPSWVLHAYFKGIEKALIVLAENIDRIDNKNKGENNGSQK